MNDKLKQYLDEHFAMLTTKEDLERAVESLAVMVQKGLSDLSDRISTGDRANSFAFSTLESRVRKLEEHASEQ